MTAYTLIKDLDYFREMVHFRGILPPRHFLMREDLKTGLYKLGPHDDCWEVWICCSLKYLTRMPKIIQWITQVLDTCGIAHYMHVVATFTIMLAIKVCYKNNRLT